MLLETTFAGPMPGAIFTTLPDGSRVNANFYEQKEDVYLDGGPGIHAPQGAAGLADGCKVYQVTDPPGKNLLSEDVPWCRRIMVSGGLITEIITASYETKIKGKMTIANCTHNQGIDIDHNALTVQLFPYLFTPNRGGEYKTWLTDCDKFTGDWFSMNTDLNNFGFIPSWSKTDNFKVRKGKPFDSPQITVRKFEDADADGALGPNDIELSSWPVWSTDPTGVTNIGYTPWSISPASPYGTWLTGEEILLWWMQTGAILDGIPLTPVSNTVQVYVAGTSGERHEVIFLNAHLGSITACKKYASAGGVPVAGWQMCLLGALVNGGTYGPVCQHADGTGCTTFGNSTNTLIAGSYTACEIMPAGPWFNITALCQNVTLNPGANETATFVNYCTRDVGMHTKGYWQNQGCGIATADDLVYLNTLAPYASGTISTNGTDNCGGIKCPDVTTLSFDMVNELGCYIVAPNSQPTYPNIGLAQQLAAFILNMRHGSASGSSIVESGDAYPVQDVISAAITAWSTGVNVTYWQLKLDTWNNAGTVTVIMDVPCEVIYE